MKKYIAFILVFLCILSLTACSQQTAVSDETTTYQVTSDIHSLHISINTADFTIKEAEAFSVESNLKYLSVSEKDGVLIISDEAKYNSVYNNPILTLFVPRGTVFEDVSIATGAAKLTADKLSAKVLKLQLGAGDVRIESLEISSKGDIEGGAGAFTVVDGTLNNLTLEMGVGKLNMTAILRGSSDLLFGVGESNLTLIGSRDDYSVEIGKGIGSVTVDGEADFDLSDGKGENKVQIEAGIGAVNLNFQDANKAQGNEE